MDSIAGPRNFATVLAELAQGEFNQQLGEDLQELLTALSKHKEVLGKGGKAKGAMTITLKFELGDHRVLGIVGTVATKAPKPQAAGTVGWVDKSGNVSWEDPRQVKLPLREVPSAAREARDVSKKGNEATT